MGVWLVVGAAAAGFLVGTGLTYLYINFKEASLEAATADRRVAELETEVERLKKEVDKGIFDILALYEFTTVLGSISNLEELYKMMVDTMLRIIRYDACALFLVRTGESRLDLVVARGFTAEQMGRLKELSSETGIVGRVVASAQPLIIDDLTFSELKDEIHRSFPFRSILSIPFVVHGEVLGVLNLYLRGPEGFNQDDLRILFIVADQAAFAIKNGQLYEKVAEQATRDGLTGLYNYRFFRAKIEEAVAEAKATGGYVSMIMADVDEFKAVNDGYGHQRGDEILKEMARLLKESVRETDIVARYGGEEFAVIMPSTPKREALAVARRIHNSVSTHDFNGLRITVSIGLATYPSPGVNSTDELISAADKRAYEAKARGKNQICYQAS